MHIQSYQIHNVLNVYRRQLSQPLQSGNQPDAARDSVDISTEAKNHAIMEKVAASVLERITNVDPESDFEAEMHKHRQVSENASATAAMEKRFTFTAIVDDNRKETRSIDIDNSQVLMRRLDELAKAAIDQFSEDPA